MIHPNAALIERLFAALNARDAAAMTACYHPDTVRFHDIAFDLKTRTDIHDMWRMICEGDSDLEVFVAHIEADDQRGVARITDQYFFGRSRKKGEESEGRPVVNPIRSRFQFRDGLIVEQIDACDARAWARQAIGGVRGWIAGRVRPLRALTAGGKVKKFLKEHPVLPARASSSAERGVR